MQEGKGTSQMAKPGENLSRTGTLPELTVAYEESMVEQGHPMGHTQDGTEKICEKEGMGKTRARSKKCQEGANTFSLSPPPFPHCRA